MKYGNMFKVNDDLKENQIPRLMLWNYFIRYQPTFISIRNSLYSYISSFNLEACITVQNASERDYATLRLPTRSIQFIYYIYLSYYLPGQMT